MGHGDYELRGAARFQDKQQSTWRKGVQWHIGDRVSIWFSLLKQDPEKPDWYRSEPHYTQVFGVITGFEANHRNRPSIKFDEQPSGYQTPPHFLYDWGEVSKA